MSSGLEELNLNKKVRGSKKPNDKPVKTREDADRLLRSVTLTWRTMLAKVAEFYDLCGFWEPVKLQIKLALLPLNGLNWDEELPELHREK